MFVCAQVNTCTILLQHTILLAQYSPQRAASKTGNTSATHHITADKPTNLCCVFTADQLS